MHRSLLAAALACAISASAFAQSSSVTFFGTMDVGARYVKNGALGSVKSEVSGSSATSKWGFRGTEDLGDGLSAGFHLEGTVNADTGTSNTLPPGQFWNRRSTVSLASSRFGELRLGRDWASTHNAWTGFDPFITLGVASANTFRTGASRVLAQAFGTAAAGSDPTLQVSNGIEYFLPGNLAGVYGNITVSAGEGGTPATGSTKGTGFRLGYASGPMDIAAALFDTRNAASNNRFRDLVIGGSYDFGVVKVAVAQRRWTFVSDKQANTLLAVSVPIGLGLIRASYVRADQSGPTAALDANDASLLGIGYIYNLSKRTALYVQAARVSNKGAATFTVPGGPVVSNVATAANYFGGQTSSGAELGLRHHF